MISKKKLERINYLSKKSKEVGLTAQEKEEQKALREEYLSAFRENFRRQLESIEIIDNDKK